MNQLREFMYANKMIDTRDQIVTPDLIKQAISKLPRIINMLQYPQYPIPSYKYGGIHIKKKNRGKFTKSAKAAGQSVQEHAHSVMNNPKASTLQRRRANFAIQAKKWAKKRKKK